MPQPIDIVMGSPLAPERKAAIDAVRSAGGADDNSYEFWERVGRVQNICAKQKIDPAQVVKAIDLLSSYISPDGEYGHMTVTNSDINPMIAAVARRIK